MFYYFARHWVYLLKQISQALPKLLSTLLILQFRTFPIFRQIINLEKQAWSGICASE